MYSGLPDIRLKAKTGARFADLSSVLHTFAKPNLVRPGARVNQFF